MGDIHGCIKPLQEIVEVGLESRTNLVFLGDYVNRGKSALEVIEFLVALESSHPGRVTCLSGNHDREFLNVLEGAPIDSFLRMGGAPTVRSYVSDPYGDVAEQLRAAVPDSHLAFLESLKPTFSDHSVVASHEFAAEPDSRFKVSGHTAQATLIPQVSENAAYIDTGCGTLAGGRLTLFNWPERTWTQSSPWDSP